MSRRQDQFDIAPHAAASTSVSRGPEHRVAAWTLAALLVLAGLTGTANLALDGVVREGVESWVYAGTMALCMLAAVPLVIHGRAGRWQTFGLVLLGNLLYAVVALCIEDPVRYASPLMLLFPAFVAAWFLGPWMLGVSMVATVAACAVALAPSYDSALGVAIQVAISAGILDTAALGVYILRRRVQRLLVTTQALSRTDPLTGLANRRHLVEQAPRVWRQARREGSRVAAMVLDLDHFKQLNDAHGHAAGDAVLRAVAASLSSSVRPSDVLARLGGEELVVLGLVSDSAEAARLAERLRSAVSGTRSADGHAVTASIGISLVRPVDGETAADGLWRLIDRADVAMYEAKQQGRDRVAALPTPRKPSGAERFPLTGDAA
ncbi:MAG TPA: GGDEF domain-containing protein [Geodermatophilus sp.]|nr:GGDEF domain-containing protein [Geodermatophilus sp.]